MQLLTHDDVLLKRLLIRGQLHNLVYRLKFLLLESIVFRQHLTLLVLLFAPSEPQFDL